MNRKKPYETGELFYATKELIQMDELMQLYERGLH